MEKFNCLIVEDEPLAAEILQDYISQVPFLHPKGVCNDAIYAMEKLQREKIDVIFLDVHLPKLKGNEFLKSLKNPPQVIFTTAYRDYAIEGYELNVVDYLVKPVSFYRFVTAVNKLRTNKTNSIDTTPAQGVALGERPHFFFVMNKKRIKLYADEILYIESLKEYIRIFTKDKTVITKFQLGQIEEKLKKDDFIRVHRSFLVAKDKIEAYTATDVEVAGKPIPIGRSYKELVHAVLGEPI